jgi:hypothetical protein
VGREHKPITVDSFMGLWDRGDKDKVPRDHFTDGLNFDWDGDIPKIRGGSDAVLTLPNIVRFFEYNRIGEASRYLILDTSGKIFDSTDLGTPIIHDTSFVDFSFLNFFNRAYITAHNRVNGISGKSVYVYNGTTMRLAAGVPPTGTLNAATSGTAGDVEEGTHLIAVAFETDSGFITKPGPLLFNNYTAPGSFKIDVSTIPTGPAGTSKRHILATKTIPSYNGNQFGYSFFFVPGGIISDNSATTLTISFFDADLIDSADYLFDILETIPAGLGLCEYNGQMVSWGEDGKENIVRVSRRGEPEVFNSIDGFLTVDPTEAEGIKNCVVFHDSLYMNKSARVYQTNDNGSAPGTWPWIGIDRGVGTEVFGIGTQLDSRGTSIESYLVADKSGLLNFTGIFTRPELTWKVEAIWKRINTQYFNQIQVVNDSKNKVIYVSIPLDSATAPSHLLVGDYNLGLDYKNIRWSLWTFPVVQNSILIREQNGEYLLVYSRASNTFEMNSSTLNDAGTAIPTPFMRTAFLAPRRAGAVNQYGMLFVRVKGSGTFRTTPITLDEVSQTALKTITLSSTSGLDYPIPCHREGERMSFKFAVTSINENFRLIETSIEAKVLWLATPA